MIGTVKAPLPTKLSTLPKPGVQVDRFLVKNIVAYPAPA